MLPHHCAGVEMPPPSSFSLCAVNSAECVSTQTVDLVCVCVYSTDNLHQSCPSFYTATNVRALSLSGFNADFIQKKGVFLFLQAKHMLVNGSQLPLKRNLTHHRDKRDE